jgi:diketogulonate reductase-like aldo/keto reductase
MAYSPLEQGRLRHDVLDEIGREKGASAAQIALAWVLRNPEVIAIPKASDPEHVRSNRAALDIELDDGDLARLDRVFPPPGAKRALEIL